jgi:hypothetical protein
MSLLLLRVSRHDNHLIRFLKTRDVFYNVYLLSIDKSRKALSTEKSWILTTREPIEN